MPLSRNKKKHILLGHPYIQLWWRREASDGLCFSLSRLVGVGGEDKRGAWKYKRAARLQSPTISNAAGRQHSVDRGEKYNFWPNLLCVILFVVVFSWDSFDDSSGGGGDSEEDDSELGDSGGDLAVRVNIGFFEKWETSRLDQASTSQGSWHGNSSGYGKGNHWIYEEQVQDLFWILKGIKKVGKPRKNSFFSNRNHYQRFYW